MDWLLYLVGLGLQQGGDWSGPQPAQYRPIVVYNGPFCGFNVPIKGLTLPRQSSFNWPSNAPKALAIRSPMRGNRR